MGNGHNCIHEQDFGAIHAQLPAIAADLLRIRDILDEVGKKQASLKTHVRIQWGLVIALFGYIILR